MKIFDAWKMLGIEATDDLAQIREVYLRLLPEYHPEDDPDGFMRLRLAYETVCADAKKTDGAGAGTDGSQAAQTGGQSEESSERTAAIERMLSDFPRRMNDGEWKKLFDEVSGQGFDCQEAFSDELLTALMEGYYLPRRIWLLFDKTFSWSARANVLKEKYPSGYIEYVLNGMRYERSIRDVFFDYEKDAGADFDAFVGDFHALLDAVHSEDFEKAAELAAENKGSLFEHPDYQLMLARLYDLREDADAANAILTGLDERWPNDPFIRTAVANMLLQSGKAGEALDIYLEVLESNPEYRSAKIGAAHARIEEGLFEEAKADAYDLLMKDPFDGSAMGVFGKANEELIPIFRERLEKDADDMDARYKLSSCLFNMGDYTKSLDLIADTTPDEAHTAKHYELYADLFVLVTGDELTDEDKAILLEYVEAWERAEKDHQRLRFLPDKYRRLCMDDTALEKSEALLAEFPGDPEICRVKAQIYKDRGDERNAFAAITAGLEKSPAHAGLLAIESLLYEKTGNLGAAVDSANMSLDGFPFTIEMWELLCRVYDHVSDYAELVDTVKRAESFGMSNDALKLMKAVALYETEDPDDEAMALFEYVLEKDADNLVCLEKLGILYARSGRPDDAAALIARFIDLSEGPYGYLLRGWFYANFTQAGDGFAKARARADFRKAIEIDDRYALAWYQLGVLAYDEGCMAEAAANFQKTLELDPEFSNVHFYLSIACERTGDFNNAARALDEGMAVFEESDKDAYEMLYLKKADLLYERHLYHEYVPLGETAAKLEQDSVNAVQRRIQLARAYFETGDDEKAEALFRRLFDDCKSLQGEERLFCMSELEYSYGYFLKTAKKDPLAALEHYKQAYEGNSSLSMLVHLAEVYRVLGQIREAKILFKKVLSRRKEAKGSMCGEYQIGRCYFGLGDLKRAKIYLHRALNRTPDYTICALPRCYDALFVLGLIALAEGDRAGARAYYEQSIDIAWDREYREAAPMFE